MSFEVVNNTIRSRFKTQVADVVPLTTKYDNAPATEEVNTSIWCRLTILPGMGKRITQGTATYRYVGVAIAQLFGPPQAGDKALIAVADDIIEAFRGVQVSGVTFEGLDGGAPYYNRVGLQGSNYQVNVNIPFFVSA